MSSHIMWSQGYQPLTRHRAPYLDRIILRKANDNRFHCHDCLQRRAAKNLLIRCEFDYAHIRCKEQNHGGAWT